MDAVATDVAVMSIAAAADLASTHYALSSCASCYEANPLMREPALSIGIKAVSVAGTAYACDRLRKTGHPRAAKVMRWVVFALWAGVAANNYRTATR